MGLETIAIVGLGIAGASAYMQYEAAKDQASATRRAAEAEQRRADIQNARAVRQSIRQARIARGTVVNTGANAGTSQSSGVLGGVASVGSQLNSNVDYLNQSTAVAKEYASAQADAGAAAGEAAQWGALGNLGGTIFSSAGGFQTIFGGNRRI